MYKVVSKNIKRIKLPVIVPVSKGDVQHGVSKYLLFDEDYRVLLEALKESEKDYIIGEKFILIATKSNEQKHHDYMKYCEIISDLDKRDLLPNEVAAIVLSGEDGIGEAKLKRIARESKRFYLLVKKPNVQQKTKSI